VQLPHRQRRLPQGLQSELVLRQRRRSKGGAAGVKVSLDDGQNSEPSSLRSLGPFLLRAVP
jgi:hypothetical protein